MAQNDPLFAQYPRQVVVRDRNFSSLLTWAFGTAAIPVPGSRPDHDFVRLRIVAERIPTQTEAYVQRTMAYFLQSASVQTNIRQYMNAFNDEATEVSLSAQQADTIAGFMPKFAEQDVADQQVQMWYVDNGFEPDEQVQRG